MVLALYDLSGIQKFIFSTNKVKEIIGASIVISKALFENIPQMLGEDTNEWKTKKFSFNSGDKKKIVYIGGGNALLMFDNFETEKEFSNQLSETVFLQSGGAIRLCGAAVEVNEGETLAENQRRLREELDKCKKASGNILPSVGISVTAQDNNNFEPLVLYGNNAMTRTQHAKLKTSNEKAEFLDSLRPSENVEFATVFDTEKESDKKSFIAVIHIDGNTMGNLIREFVEGQNGDIITALDNMRKLSVTISSLYRDTLRETLREVYNGQTGEILFRPIIADGDDITVMIKSQKAFEFTEKFIKKLAEGKKIFREMHIDFSPTAAAGIAFVKAKFPFSTAYNIAEACCKNAKGMTLKRLNLNGTTKNSIDFQVCYSDMSGDLASYREKNYIKDGCSLIKRPYIFFDDGDYSYEKFKDLCETLEKAMGKGIARSKLKGLRNSYGVDKIAAENYGRYIKAHAEKNEPITEMLSNPFDESGRAKFFDYFDIMDIVYKEAGKDEEDE